MAGDSFHAPNFSSKADMYVWLTKQAELQLDGMSSRFTPQANLMLGLANISALCFYELNRRIDAAAPLQDAPVNWFGFYLMEAAGTLALGPFQGRPACTSIRVGKGVCGTAAAERKSLVVADVHDFPGHIACDSASNSEVVVPIIDNEMVVGVIDVDSTQVGCFDEDDARGLEGIARVLAKFLHFPMSRALHANPHLAEANSGPTHHSHVPADYAALHALTLEQVSSAEAANTKDGGSVSIGSSIDVRVETVRGWRFTATNVSRISTDAEQQQLQADIGIHALPEIQYPLKTLTMGKDPDTTPILELSLVRLLESCRDFYLSPAYAAECARADLTLRVADGWASCGYDKFDPKVDWVWRNNFFGLHNTQTQRVVELPPGEEGIRWDVLQDSSLPILFNEAFTLMEDDLHDHGIMHCSLKLRVMPICFFLLFRYFVRVDGHMAYFREVRFFHEFGQTRSCPHTKEPVPHIVLEERFSQMELSPDVEESRRWSVMSEDELARSSTIKQRKLFMVDFTA